MEYQNIKKMSKTRESENVNGQVWNKHNGLK